MNRDARIRSALISHESRFGNSLGALASAAIVLICCIALLLRDPLVFWNDDYQISILPVFADIARSWSEGHLPLLSPYSWVCGNLAGEFQYGTFSVFINAAVVAIWKLPLPFAQQAAALSITHLVVLSVGGYVLARGRKLAPPLAAMVGIVAALNGWMICWGATDWFGALGAFAWLPWAWWGLERALDPQRGRCRFIWPVPFVYLLVTGGFPYTIVMLALLLLWLAVRAIVEQRSALALWPIVAGAILGFGIAAPAWLALFDYVRGSARELQPAASHLQWRVPLAAWPALVLPNWTVRWYDFSTRLMPHGATELACGTVPILALFGGLLAAPRRLARIICWELGLLVAIAAIAMLPSANLFRWSFRWLPFFHVVLAICAAEALQLIDPTNKRRAITGIIAIFAAVCMASWICGTQGTQGAFIPALSAVLVLAWCAIGLSGWSVPVLTALSFLATYLCIPPNCGVPRYNFTEELTTAAPLDPARLYLSLYPYPEVSYRTTAHPAAVGQVVRPGSSAMWGALRFINGYSPIRPAGVARALNTGIHGQVDYDAAASALANEAARDGELARLGVDGIIVAREFTLRPQPEAEWEIAHTSGEGTVYHRVGPLLGSAQSLPSVDGSSYATAGLLLHKQSRNRVAVHVDVPAGSQPAFVVFSRPYFNGYVARIAGRSFDVGSYHGFAPAVILPPGTSGTLELIYRPRWLVLGGIASAVCLAISLIAILAARLRSA